MQALAVGPTRAEERSAYRVEVLVLRHLNSDADPHHLAELPERELDALDFYSDDVEANGEAMPSDPIALAPPDEALLPPVGPFPDDEPGIEFIDTRSERMNTVWRNLRLSESFRPEIYLSWEQPTDPPFPAIRVRNEDVIAIGQDPWGPYREVRAAYHFHADIDSGEFGLRPVPDPIKHYAIEGTVRLRRSRFLHFETDISFRQPAPFALTAMAGPPLRPEYFGFEVFSLVQSRQVKTERMAYFDSPVLGVLLWVAEIVYPDEETSVTGEVAP